MAEHKIVITGAMGAGKTTAIAAVSDIEPISTDVKNHDPSNAKATTTVGLDYGEVELDSGDRLRIYGTPGQERFSFMWRIVGQGALGVIVLVDNSQPQSLAEIGTYIAHFKDAIGQSCCVVGIGRTETHAEPSVDDYAERVESLGVICPVVPVDVRRKADVLMLIDLLLTQLEHRPVAALSD